MIINDAPIFIHNGQGQGMQYSSMKEWEEDQRCLQLTWYRGKTKTYDKIAIMPHSEMLFCPLHALASNAALCRSASNSLFPAFENSACSMINSILKDVENAYDTDVRPTKPEHYTRGVTSHSYKKLSKMKLWQNQFIKKDWMNRRCGHTIKQQVKETDSAYLEYDWQLDQLCARVLVDISTAFRWWEGSEY